MAWVNPRPKLPKDLTGLEICKHCGIVPVSPIAAHQKRHACVDCYRDLCKKWNANRPKRKRRSNAHLDSLGGDKNPGHISAKRRAFKRFIQKWQRIDIMTKGEEARNGLELPPRYLRWRAKRYQGLSFAHIMQLRSRQRSAYSRINTCIRRYGPDYFYFSRNKGPEPAKRIPESQRHRHLPLD